MEQEKTNKYTIPLAIIVAGALIAGAVYMSGKKPSVVNSVDGTVSGEINLPKITDKDHYYGSKDASIVIVEYSDPECPFCKVFHNTLKEVVNSYGGKVAWVYRHFPIPQLHSKAIKESEALECANELGGSQTFWTYLDKLFTTTTSNDTLDPAELPKIASSLGIDVAAFNNCLASGKYSQKIADSMQEAVKVGARGTPYSVIVYKDEAKAVINGAEPLANVKAKIDALLK